MSAIRLRGATSGTTDVVAAAIAGDGVLTLPTGTGTLATAASVTAAQAAATAAGIAGGGLVAVAPTSIANSGGSASTTGNTTTFTGVTSISLNGIFTSEYLNYLLIYNQITSAGTDLFARLRVAGTDNTTASSYVAQRLTASSSTVAAVRTTGDKWSVTQSNNLGQNGIMLNLFNPAIADHTVINSQTASSDTGAYLALYCGTHNQSTVYDGFTLLTVTATTLTGKVTVYGYKK